MTPEQQAMVTAMQELIDALPKCKKCERLASGEVHTTKRIIGRKSYGGDPEPYCTHHCDSSKFAVVFPWSPQAYKLNELMELILPPKEY